MSMLDSLNGLGVLNFKKLIDLIIPKKERRQSEIIIGYIGIYTLLNNAFNLLNRESCKKSMEYLQIAKKGINELKFEEEAPYLKRISNILNDILKNSRAIINGIREGQASEPFHVKTSVLLAQNICVLRILKINKH